MGEDAADDANGQRHYLQLALAGDPLREVEVAPAMAASDFSNRDVRLLVINGRLKADLEAPVRSFVEAGGVVLIAPGRREGAEAAGKFLGGLSLNEDPATEKRAGRFSLLGQIDFTHPLFQAFSNPRYSDFTKIHFWTHWPYAVNDGADLTIPARFDDGSPALVEQRIGQGRVLLLAASWRPDDSQFALSSKFVPFVGSLLDLAYGRSGNLKGVTVTDPIRLTEWRGSRASAVIDPEGRRIEIPEGTTEFRQTSQPGIYRIVHGVEELPCAVNLAVSESKHRADGRRATGTAGSPAGGGENPRRTRRCDPAAAGHGAGSSTETVAVGDHRTVVRADPGNLVGRRAFAHGDPDRGGGDMMHRRLRDELEQVATRYRRLRLWQGLAVCWLAVAAVGAVVWILRPVAPFPVRAGAPLLAGCGFLAAGIVVWRSLVSARNHLWIARQVEEKYPELKSCLLAAVEQESEPGSGRFGYLQAHVIHEALDHARSRRWTDVVPARRIAWAMASSAFSFLLLLGAVIGLATSTAPQAAQASSGKGPAPLVETGGVFGVTVEPGSTEIEKGTSLLVLARISGPVPTDAQLSTKTAGQDDITLAMNRSLEDPLFGARIPDIKQPLDYSVSTGGVTKGPYHVDVFEYPRVEKADATLNFPAFTRQEPKRVQDVRTVTVVEGTQIELSCLLNKPVATAVLLEGESVAFELQPETGDKPTVAATIPGNRTRKLTLQLTDDRGRKNKVSWTLTVNVVPNTPVTLKPVFPAKDMEVSPLEEMDLAATAWDDFGVERYGLAYSLAGQEPVDVELGKQAKGREKHAIAYRIELEKLKATPDDLVSYHWWAEDLDSQGQPRRVESDMYFAEVRKFEEIFREGEPQTREQQRQQQQQQQGQSQNEQSAEQLAQLQKEIINALWRVVRRERAGALTDKFPTDLDDIRESELSALEKAAGLGEKVTDPRSMQFAEAVVKDMEAVTKQLATAKDNKDPAPLRPALASAQSAYQNLLKLRAREHQVSQQQQSQSQSRSQSRSQQQRQQLQQLDLRNQETPYESQRTASENAQETAEQREDRQVLNRLRELARRQHDLNERLKELQAALEEAKTQEQKEELQRQLKRLQEEQRQVVQDADELQSRMEQPENQERMAEQRQQLEEARNQAQRASESIDQEMAGQAAASGTRAEQEFEDLREEFRRRSSNRFAEDVRQLSDAANELNNQQQQIAQQLGNEPKPGEEAKPKSLDENDDSAQAAEELGRQRERLKSLQDRMRKTIEDAEQDEPLLTKRLYDAIRDVQDQNVEQALTASEAAVRRGFSDAARQEERVANKGIEKLNENVKSAAEAVLGDDTESLRRAREELQRLAQELNDEIARNDPDAARESSGSQGREGQPGAESRGRQPRGAQGDQSATDPMNPAGQESPAPGEGQPGTEPRDGTRSGTERSSQSAQRPGAGRPGEQDPMGEQRPGENDPRAPNGQPGQQPQRQQGQQPGQRPGENGQRQPGQGQQPSGQPGQQPGGQGQPGQEPGQERGEQSGQPGDPGQQQGQGQPGQQPGQQGRPGGGEGQGTDRSNQEPQSSEPPGRPQPGQPGEPRAGQGPNSPGRGPRSLDGEPRRGEFRPGEGEFDNGGSFRTGGEFNPEQARPRTAPLTGADFRDWSDRLRDVEEMVNDPELRAEAARIRERARGIRVEMKRHSLTPQWDVIRRQVAEPLLSLRDRVSDEVVRRASKQAVVPLDRDPVPPQYSERTRAYYERLGTGR